VAIENSLYSFDYLRIITKMHLNDLKKLIDIEELQKECRIIKIRQASEAATKYGYHSLIIVTVPSKRFFELLSLYNLANYKFSYVELAKDVIENTMDDARLESYRIKKTMVKKYTLDPHTIDTRNSLHTVRLRLEEGLFSDLTSYYGGEVLKFVVYARLSKLNNTPCIHSEWRIRGAGNIKKKINIATLKDCISFDLKQFYEKLTCQYIHHSEINRVKFGKFILGYDGRRNIYTKRQRMRIELAAITFLSIYDISSTADFVHNIRELQKVIKSQPGRKNLFQKKILSIKSHCMFCDLLPP